MTLLPPQHLSKNLAAVVSSNDRNIKGSCINGFSLVELIIAASLMLIATMVTISLFNFSIGQDKTARGKQEEQSAISQDIAAIESMNDRYNCSASSACTVSTTNPGENDYYTSGTSASTVFDSKCSDGSLIDNLLTSINARSKPAAFTRLGISTTVSRNSTLYPDSGTVVDPNSEKRYLRYTVTWTNASSQRLRQLTLVPTVAGWCP